MREGLFEDGPRVVVRFRKRGEPADLEIGGGEPLVRRFRVYREDLLEKGRRQFPGAEFGELDLGRACLDCPKGEMLARRAAACREAGRRQG
jgi:hypothetical protein